MAESKKGVLLSHDRKHVTSRVDDFASIEMGNELFPESPLVKYWSAVENAECVFNI